MNFLPMLYLDPKNPPKQIMLQFNDGSWSRRAYWGESLIPYGKENTTSASKNWPITRAEKWVRLVCNSQENGPKAKR